MDALLFGGFDQRFGGHADTLVKDLHATITGADRDLLGAVGVAIQPRFANQKAQRFAKLGRGGDNFGLHRFQPAGIVGHGHVHAGWPAVFAKDTAYDLRPFAGCYARFGASDGGWHNIATLTGGGAERPKRCLYRRPVAGFSPRVERVDLLLLDLRVNDHDLFIATGERAGLAVLIAVDAYYRCFAGFDPARAAGIGLHEAGFHVFDGGDRAAHFVNLGNFIPRLGFERFDLAVHRRIAVKQVVIFQEVGLVGHDLLHAE